MEGLIDISGIDKATLLLCLAAGQIPASFFTTTGVQPPFSSRATAEGALKQEQGYIDYFGGRAIKTDLSDEKVCPRLYDRDAGEGKFAEIVKGLKK